MSPYRLPGLMKKSMPGVLAAGCCILLLMLGSISVMAGENQAATVRDHVDDAQDFSLYAVEFLKTTVRVDEGNIRETPDVHGRVVLKLHKGKSVQLLSRQGDWYLIIVDGKQKGWAHQSILTPIPEMSDASKAFQPDRGKGTPQPPVEGQDNTLTDAEKLAAKIARGRNEYDKGNYEEALQLLLEIEKNNPENALAIYYTGLTYQGMLDYGTAKKFFARTVQLDTGLGDSWAHLGEMLYRLKHYQEAKDVLEKAIPNGARPAYVHYINGLVLMELGANAQAIRSFQKARQIDPGYTQQATYGIGMVYLREHNKKSASQAFKQAIAINPKSLVGVYANFGLANVNRPEPRSWHIDAAYNLQYDDNVVLNPSGTSSVVLPTGQSDFAHNFNLYAYMVPNTKGPIAVRVDVNYYKNLHHKITYLDLDAIDLAVTPSIDLGVGRLSVTIRQDMYWVGGRGYMYGYGAYPSMNWTIGKNQQGILSGGYQKKKYFHQILIFPGEDRNGDNYSAGYSHYVYFSKHQGYAQLGYMFDTENTKGSNWDYRGNRFTASFHAPSMGGVEFQLSADYYLQNYLHVNLVNGIKRKDKTFTVAPTVTYVYNKWVKIQLQYTYVKAVSNISVYSYSRNIMGVGFEVNY